VGKGQPLIVAEGYMDVIALASYGFEAAVAPLGTAITESQLQMLWRISPEPIIAMDGDNAGLRAAMRLIDLALPLLEAGKSLRFAVMPGGKDPDDLLREEGAPALQKRLDDAIPMVRLLWQRETEGHAFDSPERKAALDKALRDKIMLIRDPSIRSHYGQEIKDLSWQLFRPQRSPVRKGGRGTGPGRWSAVPLSAMPSTKASALAAAQSSTVTEHLREGVILAALATCPQVTEDFESDLERMRCADPFHRDLRDLLLRHMGTDKDSMRAEISAAFGVDALENLLQQSHVAVIPCIRSPGDVGKVTMTVAEELAKLHAVRGLDAEIAEAMEDLGGVADEGLTWRLSQAAKAADKARRSGQVDLAEYEVGKNGARISRDERSALDALLAQIKSQKPHG
jgi:DNA primase